MEDSRTTAALASLALTPDDVLLDLGSGTGAAVGEAAGTVRRAVGSDLSPFADGEFTAIVCTTAFHRFPKPSDTIAEMFRVLAPGGRVVIADFNRRHPVVLVADLALRRVQPSHFGLRSPFALMRDLGAAGFARGSVCTIRGRSYAFVRAEKVARSRARLDT